jgi:predicted RNA-binding Zn-ribbon protein involved in translation (DUF1610 family)
MDRQDIQGLPAELERIALELPPDSASYRVARAMHCSKCSRPSRIVDVHDTQAEFECQSCGYVGRLRFHHLNSPPHRPVPTALWIPGEREEQNRAS